MSESKSVQHQGLEVARQRAVDTLMEHFANDVLDMAEFEQRLDVANQSGTEAELKDLLADLPATEVLEESPLVQGLISACSVQGVEPVVEGMTAWVDAAFLNEAGTPAVCFGPGSIAQAHSADEWIDASEISTCADVLYQFVVDFLVGDDG